MKLAKAMHWTLPDKSIIYYCNPYYRCIGGGDNSGLFLTKHMEFKPGPANENNSESLLSLFFDSVNFDSPESAYQAWEQWAKVNRPETDTQETPVSIKGQIIEAGTIDGLTRLIIETTPEQLMGDAPILYKDCAVLIG